MTGPLINRHYPSNIWRFITVASTILAVLFLPFACGAPVYVVASTLMSQWTALISAGSIVLFVVVISLISAYRFVFYTRVEVYADGLLLRGTVSKRFARWHELDAFGYTSDIDDDREWGIWAVDDERGRRRFLRLDHIMRVPTTRINNDRVVDTGRMALTPLGRDLFHYAPQLFYDEDTFR